MRPFHIECENALSGFYDGERARVTDHAANGSLASRHEAIHGQILAETPDGQILAALIAATNAPSLPGPEPKAVARSVQIVMAAARWPHEIFATYLSCKSMSPEAEAKSLRSLPAEYVAYFKSMSKLLDGHFPSLQMQYLLAWTCSIAVFSSPLVERLDSVDLSRPIELTDDENPTRRFEVLARVLQQSQFHGLKVRLRKCAVAVCKRLGVPPWDLDSYDAWIAALTPTPVSPGSLPSVVPILLEEALGHDILDWLEQELPFTFLRAERLEAASPGFSAWVRRHLNPAWQGSLRYVSKRALTEGDSAAALDGVTLRSIASRTAESRIVNTRARRLPRQDSLPRQADSPLWRASSIAISSASPPNRNSWCVFAWPAGAKPDALTPAPLGVEVSQSEATEFLSIWAVRKARGELVPHIRAISLAISGLEDFKRIHAETANLFFRHPELARKLCWYALGSAQVQLYDLSSQLGWKVFSTALPFKFRAVGWSELVEDPYRFDGLVMRLAHIGEQPGIGSFVRLFSLEAAGIFTSFELNLGQEKVVPITDELMTHYESAAKWTAAIATEFWAEY